VRFTRSQSHAVADEMASLRDEVSALRKEANILRGMLLNPDPDSEPDNVRLHREKCDALAEIERLRAQLEGHKESFEHVAEQANKLVAQLASAEDRASSWFDELGKQVAMNMHADAACQRLCGKHGYATGHGDTVADMIDEISAQIPLTDEKSTS